MILSEIVVAIFMIVNLFIVTVLVYRGCRRKLRSTRQSLTQLEPTPPSPPTIPDRPDQVKGPPDQVNDSPDQVQESLNRSQDVAAVQAKLSSGADLDQTAELFFNASSTIRQQVIANQKNDNARKFAEVLFNSLDQALSQALQEIESETLAEIKSPHVTPTQPSNSPISPSSASADQTP